MSKETILKEFDKEFPIGVCNIGQSIFNNSVKNFISKAIDQTKKETREETIREVEEEIESWEKEDGKSFTSDKIKNILNKLKK